MSKVWHCPNCYREMALDSVLFAGEHGFFNYDEPEPIADIKDFDYQSCFFLKGSQLRYRQLLFVQRYDKKVKRFKTGFYRQFGKSCERLCPHCHQVLPSLFGASEPIYLTLVRTGGQADGVQKLLTDLENYCIQVGYPFEVSKHDGGQVFSVVFSDNQQLFLTSLTLPIDQLVQFSDAASALLMRQLEKTDGLIFCFDSYQEKDALYEIIAHINSSLLPHLKSGRVTQPSLLGFDDETTTTILEDMKRLSPANALFFQTFFQSGQLVGKITTDDLLSFMMSVLSTKQKGIFNANRTVNS